MQYLDTLNLRAKSQEGYHKKNIYIYIYICNKQMEAEEVTGKAMTSLTFGENVQKQNTYW